MGPGVTAPGVRYGLSFLSSAAKHNLINLHPGCSLSSQAPSLLRLHSCNVLQLEVFDKIQLCSHAS